MYCDYHPLEIVSYVCVASHKCQRKLCPKCQYHHDANKVQIIPNQIFLDQLQQKVRESQSNLNFQSQHSQFKTLLSQTEIILCKKFKELSLSISKIYDMMEREDQFYNILVNPISQVSKLSYQQVDQMVNVLQNEILQKWKLQKDSYSYQLEVINSQLKNEINKFIAQINQYLQGLFWEEKTQEQEGLEIQDGRLRKSKFQINFSKKRELQYIINGQIVQTILHCDLSLAPQIMTNLEKIKNLQWIGEYDQNFKKVGLWKAKWKGEIIKELGGQYSNGKMQGKWKETIANYSEKAKAYEIGEYKENFKIGAWKYIYNDQEIGGGEYDVQGLKQGNWIEIGEYFWDNCLITYIGQYQNGQKVGDWSFCLIEEGIFGYYFDKKIGGGTYKVDNNFRKNLEYGLKLIMSLNWITKSNMVNMIKMGKKSEDGIYIQ